MVFLLPDEGRIADMKRSINRRIALRTLKAPDRLNELAEHQRQQVIEQEARSEHAVAVEIQQCYRHVLYPSRNGLGDNSVTLAHAAIDIQNASEKPGSGQLQVVRQLQSQNKLREANDQPDSPAYIRDRTPLKKGQMTTGALRDEFRRDPALTILLSDDVFRKAVQNGINEGVYIYQREGLLAGQGDPIPTIHIDEQSVVSTLDFAKLKGFWPRPTPVPQAPVQSGVGTGTPVTTDGNQQANGSASTGTTSGTSSGPTTISTPVTDRASMKEFAAEGVLKEALRKVFEQARAAKLAQVDRVTVRIFEYGDAFKLIPVAGSIGEAKRLVTLSGAFETTDNSKMEFEFSGSTTDASAVRDYFERQFKAAKEATLNAALDFEFDSGLALDGDPVEKFIEKLTKFASAAAYVEARAEVK
ncbi:hypothetical protein ACRBEV_25590 [Methylobacterium phyllosphaerae]